jgi:hypothetical protein
MGIVAQRLNPSCGVQIGVRTRHFRFSLRTLLVLIAVACAVLAAATFVRGGIRRHAAVNTLVKLGAYVEYDDRSHATDRDLSWDSFWFNVEHDVTKIAFRYIPPLDRGSEMLSHPQITIVDAEPSAEDLRLVAGFDHLTHLGLRGCEVTDDDMEMFCHLPLETLDLTHTLITDQGLKNIAKITTLKALYLQSGIDLGRLRFTEIPEHRLQGPRITDAGISALADLPALKVLDLDGASVFNDSVEPLSRIKSLRRLYLARTWVHPSGIAALKKVNPQLQIIADP